MTDKQRTTIIKMRSEGTGYLAIARATNLSRDAVRKFCKNKHLSGYGNAAALNIQEQKNNGILCLYCGMPIMQNTTGRPKKFCSNKCRYDYHNRKRGGKE
ncbi:MAG: hypothetical protein LUD77_02825 [Clostridiales bacterium]|nr:hypothetical protein [Clostridiales bacterium]